MAAVAALAVVALFRHSATTPTFAASANPDATMPMHDAAAMRAKAAAWWATHPRVGKNSSAAVAATFRVQNYAFDSDLNLATQIDTVTILMGQSVRWQWVNGTHTITSGTGSLDPDAGLLFDQPMDSSHPQFTFAFANAGTYPFFCMIHESLNMRGVVIVSTSTPTRGHSWGAVKQRYRP